MMAYPPRRRLSNTGRCRLCDLWPKDSGSRGAHERDTKSTTDAEFGQVWPTSDIGSSRVYVLLRRRNVCSALIRAHMPPVSLGSHMPCKPFDGIKRASSSRRYLHALAKWPFECKVRCAIQRTVIIAEDNMLSRHAHYV